MAFKVIPVCHTPAAEVARHLSQHHPCSLACVMLQHATCTSYSYLQIFLFSGIKDKAESTVSFLLIFCSTESVQQQQSLDLRGKCKMKMLIYLPVLWWKQRHIDRLRLIKCFRDLEKTLTALPQTFL